MKESREHETKNDDRSDDGGPPQGLEARKQYRLVSERLNKGNKVIERNIISSYQVA